MLVSKDYVRSKGIHIMPATATTIDEFAKVRRERPYELDLNEAMDKMRDVPLLEYDDGWTYLIKLKIPFRERKYSYLLEPVSDKIKPVFNRLKTVQQNPDFTLRLADLCVFGIAGEWYENLLLFMLKGHFKKERLTQKQIQTIKEMYYEKDIDTDTYSALMDYC